MAVNFLVAFRVAEYAATPLRRISDATVRLAGSASTLSLEARAANASLLAIGVAANAALGAMAVSASRVEDSIARLATATETITSSIETALGNAKAAAIKFSQDYSADVETIIRAQFRLATAGVPVKEQIDAVQGSYKLAIATMGEFTVAAELLGSFLNTFGKTQELNFLSPTEKVAKITDIASAAVQKYQLDLNNLNDSLKFLVGPATTLGLPIAEVFGFAGALNTAGFRGTLAGTAISNAFNKIENAIDKLGLDPTAFTDVSGNLTDFATFLDEVERATAGMTSIERQSKFIEVFDIRAGRAINTLIQMKAGVREFVAESDAAIGTTDKLAKIIESTTSSQFKQLGNVLANTSAVIGQNVNDAIKSVMPTLKSAAISMYEFAAANSKSIAAIIGLVGATLAVSAVVITYGLVVTQTSNALAQLAATSVAARYAIMVLRGVMVFASIGVSLLAIAAALALVVSGLKSLASVFDENATLGQRLIAIVLGITSVATGALLAFVGFRMVSGYINSLVTVFNALTSVLWTTNTSAVLLARSLFAISYAASAIYLAASAGESLNTAFAEGATAGDMFWNLAIAAAKATLAIALVAAAFNQLVLAHKNLAVATWWANITSNAKRFFIMLRANMLLVNWGPMIVGLGLLTAAFYTASRAVDIWGKVTDDSLSLGERMGMVLAAFTMSVITVAFAVAGLKQAFYALTVAQRAWLGTQLSYVVAGWKLMLSGLVGVLAAVGNAFIAATAAALGFQAVTFPIWVAILIGAAGLILVIWGLIAAYDALFSSSKEVQEGGKVLNNRFVENQRETSDAIALTAKYANELGRLAKITQNKLNVKVTVDTAPLGDLPVSRAASNLMLGDRNIKAFDALNRQASAQQAENNPVIALLRQVEEFSGRGGIVDLYNGFDKLYTSINPVYAALNDFGKAAYMARIAADANQLALVSMANGSNEAAEALHILMNAQTKLMKRELNEKELTAVFEALDKQASNFTESQNTSVRELGERFTDLRKQVSDLSAESLEFKEFIGRPDADLQYHVERGPLFFRNRDVGQRALQDLQPAFQEVVTKADELIARNRGIEISFSRFRTAGNAIKTLFKGAEVGAFNYAEALPKAEAKLQEQIKTLQDLERQIESSKKALEKFKQVPGFDKGQAADAIKDLEIWLEQSGEKVVGMKVELNESSVIVASNRFNQIIKQFSAVENEVFKNLSEALKSSVSDAFTVGFKPGTTVKGVADGIRKQLVEGLSGSLSKAISAQFTEELAALQFKMEEFLMGVGRDFRLSLMLDDGSLISSLEKIMRTASPTISNLLGGSLRSGTDELRKSLFDIYDEASVKIITATAESSAALIEMQKIISQPIVNSAQLQDQIEQLRRLLISAHGEGASAAIGPIENVLQMLMSQAREQNTETPADKFLTAAQQAEIALTSVADRWAEVFDIGSSRLSESTNNMLAAIRNGGTGSVADNWSSLAQALSGQLKVATSASIVDDNEVSALSEMLNVVMTAIREMNTTAATQLTNAGTQTGANLAASSASVATNITQATTGVSQALSATGAAIATQIVDAGQALQNSLSTAATNLAAVVRSLVPTAKEFNATISSGIKDLIDNIKQAKTNVGDGQQQVIEKNIDVNINAQPQNINIQIQQSGTGTGAASSLQEFDIRKIVQAATTALNDRVNATIRELEVRLRRR